MLGKENFSSMAFYASFITVFAHFLYVVITKKINSNATFNMALMVLIIVLAVCNVFIVSGGFISFDYFKKVIIFCAVMMLMFVCSCDKVNRKTVLAFLWLNFALSLFCIIFFYFLGGRNLKYFETGLVTLGFENPNLTGMWLTICILMLAYFFKLVKNVFFRGAIVAMIALLIIIIDATGCRNAILALALTVAMWLFLRLRKNKRIGAVFIVAFVALPLLFVFVYFAVLNSPLVDQLDFLVSEGKGLNSRATVWSIAFEAVRGFNFFVGDYFDISKGTGQFQQHNILLDVMAAYGVPVLLLVIAYISKIIHHADKHYNKHTVDMGIVCFFGIWFLGLGEAAIITGGNGIYIPCCFTLALASSDV